MKNNKTCYFISPHFDDAYLSAGSRMATLSQTNKIVVINVFTKASGPPYTLSARTNLRQCGHTDARALYEARRGEDQKALADIADQIINLDFVDGLWRKKQLPTIFLNKIASIFPETRAIYPTYRWHVATGKIAKADYPLLLTIKEKLSKQIIEKDAQIFCPAAIGNHIDHVITRKVCEDLFPHITYWSDFPYNILEKNTVSLPKDVSRDEFIPNLLEKEKRLQLYKTQFSGLFPDGKVPEHKETFFVTNVSYEKKL